MPGAETVNVNLSNKEARVVLKRNAKFDLVRIVKIANKSRYSFKVKATKKFYTSPTPLLQGKKGLTMFPKNFSKNHHYVRIVTLLSPTGKSCNKGLKAIKNAMDAQKDTKLELHLIWQSIEKKDTMEAADEISRMFGDNRVIHYWDGKNEFGKKFKNILKLEKIEDVRDIYLLYAPGVKWNQKAEEKMIPDLWAHQLSRADKELRLKGKKLEKFMIESIGSLSKK